MVCSSSEKSEIISPIPRRHHYLQASESRHWLPSPSISPVSTRAASPSPSHPTTSPRSHRFPPRARLSSVIEQSGTQPFLFPSTSQPSIRVRPADDDKRASNEGSMSRRWVRWMHKQGMKHWVLPSVILISTWIKWSIGLGTYSGEYLSCVTQTFAQCLFDKGHNTPPMYGDYEAQRHWMELTIHLPTHQWYTYDLEYWGLDYPPLTAYVSWLCGVMYVLIQYGSSHRLTAHLQRVVDRSVMVCPRQVKGNRTILQQDLYAVYCVIF